MGRFGLHHAASREWFAFDANPGGYGRTGPGALTRHPTLPYALRIAIKKGGHAHMELTCESKAVKIDNRVPPSDRSR